MARPAQISREAVLRASLAIADSGGLDAVTMQAVARRLGVTPMALYRHVAGKADLLDALVEGLLTEFPLPPGDLPPGERLRALGRSIREVARRHPSLFPLLLQRPATTPESRRVRDAVRAALQETGLPDAQARQAERLLSTVVLGFAASEAAGRFRDHPRSVIDRDFACLEGVIARVLEDIGRPGRRAARVPDGTRPPGREARERARAGRAAGTDPVPRSGARSASPPAPATRRGRPSRPGRPGA